MTNRTCTIDGCARPHHGKGFCAVHLQRVRRTGTPNPKPQQFNTAEESFAARTGEREIGCIEWTGAKTRDGYGHIRLRGRAVRVHRYAWERVNGPIPDGMVVDHLCWNRACVNVEHLRLVTQAQNAQNRESAQRGTLAKIRGVSWCETAGKWRARVQSGGKVYYGGYFHDKEEAGRVAAEMRSRLMTHSQN